MKITDNYDGAKEYGGRKVLMVVTYEGKTLGLSSEFRVVEVHVSKCHEKGVFMVCPKIPTLLLAAETFQKGVIRIRRSIRNRVKNLALAGRVGKMPKHLIFVEKVEEEK